MLFLDLEINLEPFNLSPRQQTVATPYSHSTELIGDLREAAIDIGYGIYKRSFGFEEDSNFDITEHL